jgi:hypothetical protein
MSAQFPASVKVWSSTDATYPKNQETVLATHVTEAYNEITSIQRELGSGELPNALRTSVAEVQGSFVTSTSIWTSLRSRLNNMEQGIFVGVNRRVSIGGGSTITPSGASVVGLNIRAASGQTANVLEIRNSSNTVVNSFNSSGQFVGVINGGTA